MAKESLDNSVRIAGAEPGLSGLSSGIAEVLRELQGITVSVVTGDDAATNIAVTGIATEDTLVGVVGIDGDAVALADSVISLTAEASITSAGNIQCSTTGTSAYRLVVLWLNKQ